MASLVSRLYRGETNIDFIGTRKRWYTVSLLIILLCTASFIFRGFNYGIEFAGGTQVTFVAKDSSLTTTRVSDAFTTAGFPVADAPQEVGSGATRQIVAKTRSLDAAQQDELRSKLTKELGVAPSSIQAVSSSWGHDVTMKAVEGLIVFLIVVSIYISIRFSSWRMAAGGIIALLHDLLVAAGVYSIIGFEVTPSTIVGLLTILGFSLYDTVVVYDKVGENSRNLLAGSRMTFGEAANLAVNQTLMRSINTSLIALLPVAGLLFVGAGLLGVGTIKDLALILFVGIASGTYSSLFLATPIVVDLTERQPEYQALTRRVQAKRASAAAKGEPVFAGPREARRHLGGGPAPAPKPGARPTRRKR